LMFCKQTNTDFEYVSIIKQAAFGRKFAVLDVDDNGFDQVVEREHHWTTANQLKCSMRYCPVLGLNLIQDPFVDFFNCIR